MKKIFKNAKWKFLALCYNIINMFEFHPEVLWHYCPYETFIKIISNGKIFLSDVIQSNDRTELLTVAYIQKRLDDEFDNICDTQGPEIAKNHFDLKIKSNLLENIYKQCYVWTFCMSSSYNNLWSWIEYGDKYSGVAIGLDYKKLCEEISRLNEKNELTTFKIIKVKYFNKINQIKWKLDEIFESVKSDNNFRDIQTFINKVALPISKFKTNEYEQEKETRIVAVNGIKDETKQKYNINKKERLIAAGTNIIDTTGFDMKSEIGNIQSNIEYKFHVKNNTIVPHIECPIDLKNIIRYVTCCNNHSEEEISKILRLRLGENKIKVKQMSTPYKNK